ncbi:MAG TPA: cupin domain-containing protein [Methanocella sp.]|uniref:cupin domain-containing protein n=1 Tax=Methanocella sp. TaxID=2052833 RepID=UPI002BC6C999|nr:cupin domain-containing protein [Methanocella sp.]HTY89630.1 cupin domain-containing protein [Methanocella sp.]
MSFYDLNRIEYKLKREGAHVKAITGERIQVMQVRLDVGFESDHSHPEEQVGLVLSGQVELTVGGETRMCGAGAGYCIPPNVRHSFKVLSRPYAEIIDIFSPPKEENNI